jgi:hypothetical protein
VVTADRATNIVTAVTLAFQAALTPDAQAVLFDLDIGCATEFARRADDVPPTFEALRQIKNRVFFLGLTEQAVARYE